MKRPLPVIDVSADTDATADDRPARCACCGDRERADGRRPKAVDVADPGERGTGLMSTAVPLCDGCRALLAAPIDDGRCIVCGDENASFSFEVEGKIGADDLDVYYGGSLCAECSRSLVFDLQTRADGQTTD